jgi:hypothetical protein
MKTKSWLGLTAAGLVALFLMTGCTEETPPGGPGATTTTEDGDPAQPEATFQLELPSGATNIEQGASEQITIGIDRGDELQDEVQISFRPPQGVTIDPEQTTIPPGAEEVEVTLMVDATAPPGELMIDVEGQAAAGPPSTGQFRIEVTERENADDQPATDTAPPAGTTDPESDVDAFPPAPVNPEGGAPDLQDPNAAPQDPANPEEGAPAVREEEIDAEENPQ